VGREGLETMVFTLAILFATTTTHAALGGGAAGLAVSLLIAFAMYRLGKRLNVAVFFTFVGALLMVFAAGILVDAVENLQQLGWLPILTHPMWNTAHVLSEDSTVGDIFHSFFGYAESPTVGQGVVYLTYLTVAIGAFIAWRPPRRPHPASRPSVAAPTGAQLPAT
jgi:high-affinity iron transporter